MLRSALSVKDGWYPATDALEQYYSAASGDVVYGASFRTRILNLQNHGEAVQSLQRAIHDGAITAKGLNGQQAI